MSCDSKHHSSSTLEGDKVSSGPNIPTRIEHKHFGVWEFFEEIESVGRWLTAVPLLGNFTDLMDCWPYLLRMLRDVLSIPGCSHLALIYATTTLGLALIPAITIW
ncbi:hypothetical protein C8Q74DRAFT_137660 [Fomes fomentarius]|nr:hypothetical protein C8Q74DRAFT_137660 [Fomes fomentarius]